MDIKTTTAIRKIASLRKRIWCIQGGQGAGKTFSILQIIINHASSKANKDIYIVSEELSKMRKTVIKDFVFIMKAYDIFTKSDWIGGSLYRFPNGSTISFLGLDKNDIGKGLRSDLVFVNEANKIDFETYSELTSRAKRVIIDFNPNKEFWVHDEVITRIDCDYLNLTFLDNEALDITEKKEILLYKEKGYDDNGNEINQFWANKWRVYGLGELGRLSGAIFENWSTGEFREVSPIAYGLDFGSKDPDALVKVSIDHKESIIYVKEELYQNNLSTKQLCNIVKQITGNKLVIADSAGKRTIEDLKSSGVNVKSVSKNQIIDDIKILQGYTFVVDPTSTNLIVELSNYIWLERKGEVPIDKYNHLIDAFRYIVQTLVAPKKRSTQRLGRKRK